MPLDNETILINNDSLPLYIRVLQEFENLPEVTIHHTYLGLCQYPRSRFEEICSRILGYFLDKQNDHGFGTLFLEALISCASKKFRLNNCFNLSYYTVGLEHLCPIPYSEDKVNESISEKPNRLDIIITGMNWCIGIENKIYADLYNRIDVYKLEIEKVSTNNLKLVLSLKEVFKDEEHKKILENDFKLITYKEFFKEVLQNIGKYFTTANQANIYILNDFIKQIENMTNNSSEHRNSFFHQNIDEILQLENEFEQFYKLYNDNVCNHLGKLMSELNHNSTSGSLWTKYNKRVNNKFEWSIPFQIPLGNGYYGLEFIPKEINSNGEINTLEFSYVIWGGSNDDVNILNDKFPIKELQGEWKKVALIKVFEIPFTQSDFENINSVVEKMFAKSTEK